MDEKYRRNVLILDPEPDTAELYARALEAHGNGCKCYWVKSAHEAKGLLAEIPFTFFLADLTLLEEDHFMLLNTIGEMSRRTMVIVNAYLNQKEDIKKGLEMGAAGYFIKPVKINLLRKLIDDFSAAAEGRITGTSVTCG